MPAGFRREDHFDEFQAISRNPYYKPQPDGSLRHETELIVDRGIEFVKSQPKDKPFALNLWFNACHAEDGDRRPGIGHFPWPQAVNGMYEDVEIAPPRLGGKHPDHEAQQDTGHADNHENDAPVEPLAKPPCEGKAA